MAKSEFSYEKSLQRIEEISQHLDGNVSIEELEMLVKEAKALIEKCKSHFGKSLIPTLSPSVAFELLPKNLTIG